MDCSAATPKGVTGAAAVWHLRRETAAHAEPATVVPFGRDFATFDKFRGW